MRQHGKIILLLLLLATGIVFLPAISVRMKTVAVILNLVTKSHVIQPYDWVTYDAEKIEYPIDDGRGAQLDVRLYKPPLYKMLIVIYAPWAKEGKENGELNHIAKTFALAGNLVAVYSRPPGAEYVLPTKKNTDELVTIATHFLDDPKWEVDSLGFFGVSAGTGPIFRAATHPRIVSRLKVLLAFSPFYDHEEVRLFFATGHAEYGDIKLDLEPSPRVSLLMAKEYEFYEVEIKNTKTSEKFTKLRNEISPMIFVPNIRVPVFIVHSKEDAVYPYTQALELADSLRSHVPVTLYITDVIHHGGFRPLTFSSLREYYIPSAVGFYKFLLPFFQLN